MRADGKGCDRKGHGLLKDIGKVVDIRKANTVKDKIS